MKLTTPLLPLLAFHAWGASAYHCYVGDLGSSHALIAWGTTVGKGNTIGRDSVSHGSAVLIVGDKKISTTKNWAAAEGLLPDTEYSWRVEVEGRAAGNGKLRTWPARSTRLCFFVIGDFGTGGADQFRLARAMQAEMERRAGSGNPVRFVLTTGDNIYGTKLLRRHSGDEDVDWTTKFFEPYRGLIGSVPFYATLGNHDGNDDESRGDLAAYLDNFFFPGGEPARYYSFRFADLAEFFALDTTSHSLQGPKRAMYSPGGEQHQWLQRAMKASTARWKIPYYHHAPFCAGPRHEASRKELGHFMELFRASGVRVAFNGHEHNFQYTFADEATGGIRYVTTGSGGELRRKNPRKKMEAEHIEGWAPQHQFLAVEIDGKTLSFAPVSYEPVKVLNHHGAPLTMPIPVQ